jgi:hypothetical protein
MKMTEIQKMYLRARGRWSRNLGKEEANKKATPKKAAAAKKPAAKKTASKTKEK